MKSEETDPTLNHEEEIDPTSDLSPEESLPSGHNPDIGTPETHSKTAAPKSELEQWQLEAADWKDKYLRLYADFDNYRKRSSREKIELLSNAGSDVIRELLPVIDDFDRAVKANEQVNDPAALREGFSLIHAKMYKQLESKGLKPIDAIGKPFDTDFHEAITSVPASDPSMIGKVVDEVEKGYMMNDRVIRFSKVVTAQ